MLANPLQRQVLLCNLRFELGCCGIADMEFGASAPMAASSTSQQPCWADGCQKVGPVQRFTASPERRPIMMT